MTEQNQAWDLLATLRNTLQQLASHIERTRDSVDEITSHVTRLREGVEALGDLQPREVTSVGIDMLVDAATDFLEAFRELESGVLEPRGMWTPWRRRWRTARTASRPDPLRPPGCSSSYPMRNRNVTVSHAEGALPHE